MIFKNGSSQGVYLYAYNTTSAAPDTGDAANITGKITKDGGAGTATATANPTEIGGGVYWQPLSQTETNANNVALYWVSTTAGVQIDPVFVSTTAGAIPFAVAAASGGLPTIGTGVGQVSPDGTGAVPIAFGESLPSSPTAGTVGAALKLADTLQFDGLNNVKSNPQTGVDVVQWNGTNCAGTIPPDVVFLRSGTAQAGGASTITLDSGASATNGFYQNAIVFIRGGTGAGQSAFIASYVGATKVATINGTWTTNPDSTSTFSLLPLGAVSATVSGGVNVTQWGGIGVGGMPNATIPPTTGQIATAIWQDLTAGADFTTANSVGKLIVTDLDTNIGSRQPSGNVTVGGYAANEDPATVVLGATASTWNTAGTIGAKINSAGSAGDPWSTALPGSYASGTAGNIVGNNLNATVSSRSAPATAQTIDLTTALPGSPTAGTVGEALKQADKLLFDASNYVKSDNQTAVTVSGNVTVGGYASGQDPATLVLGATASSWNAAGTIGADINRLDAAISSRMATFALPANFAALGISAGGAVQVDGTSPMTESYTTGAFTLAQGLYEITQVVGQNSISGTTITVQKRDKASTACTFSLDSSSAPTLRSRAS